MQLNRVMLAGRITKELESKVLQNGSNVCSFSIAVNRSWKDDQGVKVEKVEFINCVMFGKSAEAFVKWNHKGDEIYVEGRIQNRSWDKPDGTKGYATDIVVDKWDFVQKARSNSARTDEGGYESYETEKPKKKQAKIDDNGEYEELPVITPDEEEINIEDIPF